MLDALIILALSAMCAICYGAGIATAKAAYRIHDKRHEPKGARIVMESKSQNEWK